MFNYSEAHGLSRKLESVLSPEQVPSLEPTAWAREKKDHHCRQSSPSGLWRREISSSPRQASPLPQNGLEPRSLPVFPLTTTIGNRHPVSCINTLLKLNPSFLSHSVDCFAN